MKQQKKNARNTAMALLITCMLLLTTGMLTFSFALTGCADNRSASNVTPEESENDSTESSEVTYCTVERSDYSFAVNSGWIEKEVSDGLVLYYPEGSFDYERGPFIQLIQLESSELAQKEASTQLMFMRNDFEDTERANGITERYVNIEEGFFDSRACISGNREIYRDGKLESVAKVVEFFTTSDFVVVRFVVGAEDYESHMEELEFFAASLSQRQSFR